MGAFKGGVGLLLVSKGKTNRALVLLLPRACAVIPLSSSSGRAWTAIFPLWLLLGLPQLGFRGY